MPFLILYGGELVFAFIGARVALWMWRSRENVMELWRERHGAPPSGPSFEPDPAPARLPAPPVRLEQRRPRSSDPTPLPRAA